MNLTLKIQLRVLLRGSGITESTDVGLLKFVYRSSQLVGKIIFPAYCSLVSVRVDSELLHCSNALTQDVKVHLLTVSHAQLRLRLPGAAACASSTSFEQKSAPSSSITPGLSQ